jgi:MraZ protein
MPDSPRLLLGEYRRTIDERHRVLIPKPLAELLGDESADCILAKERPGCLSLWPAPAWQAKLDEGVGWIAEKVSHQKLEGETARLQMFGRLFSTRHAPVQLAGRGRLVIPEGFREFLGVDPKEGRNDVMVVGAAVCVEIWNPVEWLEYLKRQMPKFRRLFDHLTQ